MTQTDNSETEYGVTLKLILVECFNYTLETLTNENKKVQCKICKIWVAYKSTDPNAGNLNKHLKHAARNRAEQASAMERYLIVKARRAKELTIHF